MEILEAFKNAKGKFSTTKIVDYLEKLDYTYPYHQSIGFLLKRAGYEESHLEPLKKIGLKFNFYFTHKMEEMDYSNEWKLFYPKILE